MYTCKVVYTHTHFSHIHSPPSLLHLPVHRTLGMKEVLDKQGKLDDKKDIQSTVENMRVAKTTELMRIVPRLLVRHTRKKYETNMALV